MKTSSNASPPMLAWLVALLLSVGLNVYLLLSPPPAGSPAPAAAATRLVSTLAPAAADDDDDDDNEEDDASWVALSEELRQTRRQLAECQGRQSATARQQVVSQ